jgi:hypothetical protein
MGCSGSVEYQQNADLQKVVGVLSLAGVDISAEFGVLEYFACDVVVSYRGKLITKSCCTNGPSIWMLAAQVAVRSIWNIPGLVVDCGHMNTS